MKRNLVLSLLISAGLVLLIDYFSGQDSPLLVAGMYLQLLLEILLSILSPDKEALYVLPRWTAIAFNTLVFSAVILAVLGVIKTIRAEDDPNEFRP